MVYYRVKNFINFKISGRFSVGGIIAPNQKWRKYQTDDFLVIEKVNNKNGTFAGSYEHVTRSGPKTVFKYPFRGEFDPHGTTIGWVVSYRDEFIDNNVLAAWAGYSQFDPNTQRPSLSTMSIVAHQSSVNTTAGYDTFLLEPE